jgi:PD-(D/E)XK nuclease superfamily
MLVNDSVTVAVEIPVFLTNGRQCGFDLGFESNIITGHIDFLQIRNGDIHILDYKPESRKETHAHVQLTIYAPALARRTNLPLKFFKCGWFDEKDYFEFFPLKAVYPLRHGVGEWALAAAPTSSRLHEGVSKWNSDNQKQTFTAHT